LGVTEKVRRFLWSTGIVFTSWLQNLAYCLVAFLFGVFTITQAVFFVVVGGDFSAAVPMAMGMFFVVWYGFGAVVSWRRREL